MVKVITFIVNFILFIFSRKIKKIQILKHNNIDIEKYPENKWFLIPYPVQKGPPFNADNLTTVNRSSFLQDAKFLKAKKAGELRWGDSIFVRDISWRLHIFLWSVSYCLESFSLGDEIFVECGTGKGYMAAASAEYFKWGINSPCFYLIDTFKSTMPNDLGLQVDDGEKLFPYAENDIEIKQYFSKYKNFHVITGFIPEVLIELPKEMKIKFLHLDLNNSIAEADALNYLRKYFTTGTLILFDDFGGPGGEKQALIHEKFAESNGKYLLQLPTGQALMIW